MVADALSRKTIGSLAHIALARRLLVEEIRKLEFESVHFELRRSRLLLAYVRAKSSLIKHIKTAQYDDLRLCKLMKNVCNGNESEFSLDQGDVLRCGNHLCMLNVGDKRRTILEETHGSRYTIHPSSTKMY